MNTHYLSYGDTLTPLGCQLKQKNTSGTLAVVSLTGKTVKVFVTDEAGTTVVTETETGVTVVDAANGKVQYDFQGGASLLDAGDYYVYFRVYSGAERDTYPVETEQMHVVIQDPNNP